MNTLLDNLFSRRPKIHYVCPPICGLQFVPTSSGAPSISFDGGTAGPTPLNCVSYETIGNLLAWTGYPGAICYNVYWSPPPEDSDITNPPDPDSPPIIVVDAPPVIELPFDPLAP